MASATIVYTLEDVGKHNREGDLWMAIDGKVFDLSKFARLHPGGIPPLLDPAAAGKDASELFFGLHRASVLDEPRYKKLQIGVLEKPAAVESGKAKKKQMKADTLTVPYGEAMGTFRKTSPYYKESHHRLRKAVREFMNEHVKPFAKEWDDNGVRPSKELDKKLGEAGIVAALMAAEEGMGELLAQHNIKLPGGVNAEEFDYFHSLVLGEELRVGCAGCYGFGDGMYGGTSIGLAPLLKFGSPELIKEYAVPCLKGEKRICLAISEPYAGSDVAQIRTTATPNPEGGWTVNGVKKWITSGMVSDYFTTLCRTEKEGPHMLLLERDEEGGSVTTNPIKTSYSPAASTAYVMFHKAQVPPKRLMGRAGQGFYQTMSNFNFERWGMVGAGNRHARMVVEEAFKWAVTRKVFGKPLIQQPVIRFKLGEMIGAVETVHSMLEDLTYQMCQMSVDQINKDLAGPIALLKFQQSRAATLVSDNACQILGGRAVTATGMGYIVEKFQKSFKFMAILGGSEEIMNDFAIRQAMRGIEHMPAKL